MRSMLSDAGLSPLEVLEAEMNEVANPFVKKFPKVVRFVHGLERLSLKRAFRQATFSEAKPFSVAKDEYDELVYRGALFHDDDSICLCAG